MVIVSNQMFYSMALSQVGEFAIDELIALLCVVLVSGWGILVNQL